MKINRRKFLAGTAASSLLLSNDAKALSPHDTPGDAPVPHGWHSIPIGDGGYITGIDITAAGAARGAVCRTDTSGAYFWDGAKWNQVCNRYSLGMTSPDAVIPYEKSCYEIRVAPSDPNYLYMIWGTPGLPPGSNMVYASADKGAHWTATELRFHIVDWTTTQGLWGYSADLGNSVPGKFCSQKIVIDPNNPRVCYVGIPIQAKMDAGTYSTNEPGLFRTLDAGATWTQISTSYVPLPTELPGFAGMVIDANYGSPTTTTLSGVIVTKRIIIPVSGQGVFESLDGGATWSQVTSDVTPSTLINYTTSVSNTILVAQIMCTGQGSVASVTNTASGGGTSGLTWNKRDLSPVNKADLIAGGMMTVGLFEYWALAPTTGTYHISVNYNPGNISFVTSSMPAATGTGRISTTGRGDTGDQGSVLTITSGSGFAAGQYISAYPHSLSIVSQIDGTPGGAGRYQLDSWASYAPDTTINGFAKVTNQVNLFAVKNADTTTPFANSGASRWSSTGCTISGNKLTIPHWGQLQPNGFVYLGQSIADDLGNIAPGTVISAMHPTPGYDGTGGAGTYGVSVAQTVSVPETMYGVEVGPVFNGNEIRTLAANSLIYVLLQGKTTRVADTNGVAGATITCSLMGGTSDLPRIANNSSDQNLWAEVANSSSAAGTHRVKSINGEAWLQIMDAVADGGSNTIALDGSPVYARSGPSPGKQPVQISNAQIDHTGTYWACNLPGFYNTPGGLWRYKSGTWDRIDGSYGAVDSRNGTPGTLRGNPGSSTWGQAACVDPRADKAGYVTACILNVGYQAIQTQNGNAALNSIRWVGGPAHDYTQTLTSAIGWLNHGTAKNLVGVIGDMFIDPSDGTYWQTGGHGVLRIQSTLNYDLRNYSLVAEVLDEGIEQTLIQQVLAAPGAANILIAEQDQQVMSSVLPDYPTSIVFSEGDSHCWSIDFASDNPRFIAAYCGGGNFAPRNPQAGYSVNHGLAGSWREFDHQPKFYNTYGGCIACSSTGADGLTSRNTTANLVVIVGATASCIPQYTLDCGTTGWKNTDLPTRQYLTSITASQLIAADRVNANTFYVYAPGSDAAAGIYRSTNSGANFSLQNNLILPNAGAFLLSVPGYAGHLWLAPDYQKAASLYYSVDGAGVTWTAVPGMTNCIALGIGRAYPNSYPTIFVAATVGGTFGIYKGVCPLPFNISNFVWTRLPENPHLAGVGVVCGDWNVVGRCYAAFGSGWGADFYNP